MRRSLALAILLLLLPACVAVPPTPGAGARSPTAAITLAASPTPAPTRTPTPQPTLTSTLPPPTPPPPDTPTPTPDSGVTQNCLPIQSELPKGHGYIGTIAFANIFPGHGEYSMNELSLYDLHTGKVTMISDEGVSLSVSPDRTLLAYKDLTENLLKIFSSDAKRVKSMFWRENWRSIERWLDNQNLLIVIVETEDRTRTWQNPPKVLLVNPFTDHSQTLLPDYPEIDLGPYMTALALPWPSSLTIYSSDLKRVVYPGVVYPGSPDVSIGYILYGIPEEKKLAQIPNVDWGGHPPVWSPDGSRFIMVGNYEFYLVSYDGVISQITHLNPDFDEDKRTGFRYLAEYYSWSPDSRHVAFWLSPFGTDRYTLATLDTASGQITDYCIPIYDRSVRYPVWSPDGKNLVVAANSRLQELGNDVILVDLEKMTSFKVTSNNFPVGWLVSP